MRFTHLMIDRDVILVLDLPDPDRVFVVRRFCLKRGKPDPAAADNSFTRGLYHVPADGAYVQLHPKHFRGFIRIHYVIAGKQLNDRNAKSFRQGLDQRDIRVTPSGLPSGHRLVTDTDRFRKLILRDLFFFTQPFDHRAGNILIHFFHLLALL